MDVNGPCSTPHSDALAAAYALVPNLLPDLVAVIRKEGQLLSLNEGGRTLLGRRRRADDESSFHEWVKNTSRARWNEACAQAVTGGAWSGEIEFSRGDGSEANLSVRLVVKDDLLVLIGRPSVQADQLARELAETKIQLGEASRVAGTASMANGVLHNVGNACSSVTTSVALLVEQLEQSRAGNVGRGAQLLADQADLGLFFSTDQRGRQMPAYLKQLATQLDRERDVVQRELDSLRRSVDHIKTIISLQQKYTHGATDVEIVTADELMEEALRIGEASLARHRIDVVREYGAIPPLRTSKHRVLQILINLIRNAKHALDEQRGERKVYLRTQMSGTGRMRITVSDTGVGISPEDFPRLFSLGFSTRRNGHGFGLYTSARTAAELGGSLSAHSDGRGKGATFYLELPIEPPLTS